MQKRDGQWFAEFLGIDPAFVAAVHGSDGKDQKQARAMQTALWPATLGYWMNTLFTPTGARHRSSATTTIDNTRAFFTQYVSGRGPLPAIRIGGQPYGILPATAFSRIQWYDQQEFRGRSVRRAFLGDARTDPAPARRRLDGMSKSCALGGRQVATRTRRCSMWWRIIPRRSSTTRAPPKACSRCSTCSTSGRSARTWWQAIINLDCRRGAWRCCGRLGYTGSALPDLLNHFFLTDNPQIATVIDDRPLSETKAIRAYTDAGKQLHPVADRRGRHRSRRCARRPASPTTSRRRRCSICTCAMR